MEEIRFETDCDISAIHFHDELELFYVLSGRAGIMLTGSNYMLEQEGFIVFNPFQNHEIYREAGCHTLSAYIPFSLVQYCGLGKVACCSAVQQDQVPYLEMIRARLAVIFKNYMEGSVRRRLYILSNILGLLAVLKQQFEPRTEQPDEKIRHPANKMQQVLLYIHAHYTENITLQDVADNAYMSVSHLSRKFEKQTGMHFSEYLRNIRLYRAAGMLRNSDKAVIEIAEACGFFNVNTFTVNFKKMYGTTPSIYKKQQIELDDGWKEETGSQVNYVRLLKYAPMEESIRPLDKKLPDTIVKSDVWRAGKADGMGAYVVREQRKRKRLSYAEP